MIDEASRIPVIVGVGQINDRPDDPIDGLDPLGLMEAALRAADGDAGGGWLAQLDSVAVIDQIGFRRQGDLSGPLAERVGARPRVCYKTATPSGDGPILLLNEAANRIGAGEIESAAVVGGEALRTAARRAAQADATASPNAARDLSARAAPAYRQRYGLVAPVDVYPLYENATRAAWAQTLAQAQQESAEIWALFSEVASETPGAWLRKPVTAETIRTPSADNRPIAFPYTKLMVANSAVNQGAGFIVSSLAKARARGVPEERLIYVRLGAAAHEPDDLLARDSYARSSSMEVSIRRALELNRLSVGDLDLVELYSCFPCVPKMARRVLGWPADRPATVFGGLTFGGGPIGNYMSHAVVSMTERLRRQGRHGLLFANGGYATHNHTIVLSRSPAPESAFPQTFDFQSEAEANRGLTPPVDEAYLGPGVIETYTVLFERDGSPRFGVIVGRSPGGGRFLAKVPRQDEAALQRLTAGEVEPVGSSGEAFAGSDGETLWRVGG